MDNWARGTHRRCCFPPQRNRRPATQELGETLLGVQPGRPDALPLACSRELELPSSPQKGASPASHPRSCVPGKVTRTSLAPLPSPPLTEEYGEPDQEGRHGEDESPVADGLVVWGDKKERSAPTEAEPADRREVGRLQNLPLVAAGQGPRTKLHPRGCSSLKPRLVTYQTSCESKARGGAADLSGQVRRDSSKA